MNDVVRALAIALLLSCLPIATTIGAGAAGAAGGDQAASIATAATAARDNETVRHRHPDEYDGESDSDRLEAWLSSRLAEQLQNSTRALSEDEYDLAREYLGEEYRERYGQYVEVAGEPDGNGGRSDGSGDATAAFEETAREQKRLIDLVETYEETNEEYERARDAGDEERARELARELEDLAAEIEATGGTVATNYEIITMESDGSGGSSDPGAGVSEAVADVRQRQQIVRTEQFVETELVLAAGAETGSFSDPIPMRGELRTADDSTIANETVRLEIDGQPIDVRTDADGALDFEYRPTTQRLSDSNVTVEYVPEVDSTYLGSETAVAVSIEQVDPTIEDFEATAAVAYNESLSVEGTMSVDGVPVDDVSLDVVLGETAIGTVNATDGTFAETVRLPADVPAGERSLSVAFPHDDRALAATNATTAIDIVETDADLTLDVTPITDAEFRVEGRLATIDGEGVPNQSIAVRIDGARAGTISTGPEGEFSEKLTAAEPIDDETAVVAVYDDPETNLAATRAEASVRPPGSGGSLLGGALSAVSPSTGLAGALGLAGVVAAIWWRRRGAAGERSPRESSGTGAGTASSTTSASAPAADSAGATDPALVDALFARSRDDLSNGNPERAVRTCYAAVRRACASDPASAGPLTHWEFYRQYVSGETAGGETADGETADDNRGATGADRTDGDAMGADRTDDEDATGADRDAADDSSRDRDRLRAITETYERAVFAPETVSRREAARLLDVARSLCTDETTSPSSETEPRAPIADD